MSENKVSAKGTVREIRDVGSISLLNAIQYKQKWYRPPDAILHIARWK